METDPITEGLCFIVSRIRDSGEVQNPVIQSVIHHCETSLDSTQGHMFRPHIGHHRFLSVCLMSVVVNIKVTEVCSVAENVFKKYVKWRNTFPLILFQL
jgi:hypothetical protein